MVAALKECLVADVDPLAVRPGPTFGARIVMATLQSAFGFR
jgi:hypothetical protein